MSNKLKDAIAYYKSCSEYNDEIKTLINIAEKYLEASDELPEKMDEEVECGCVYGEGCGCTVLSHNKAIDLCTIPYMKLKEENNELKELYHKKCNKVRELKEQLARLSDVKKIKEIIWNNKHLISCTDNVINIHFGLLAQEIVNAQLKGE